MEQDSRPIIFKVAKAARVRLDELNRAIESFGAGVADPVPAVIEQASLMAPEHPDHFLDRLQSAAHGVSGPCVEEAFRGGRITIGPELRERFLDTPRAAGLEIELMQGSKRDRVGAASIGIGFEPVAFAARYRRLHFLGQQPK